MLRKADLPESIAIDASHANSRKQPDRQAAVAQDIASQVERGDQRITGLVLESFIEAGRQDVVNKEDLVYGQSITDPWGWDDSIAVLGAGKCGRAPSDGQRGSDEVGDMTTIERDKRWP